MSLYPVVIDVILKLWINKPNIMSWMDKCEELKPIISRMSLSYSHISNNL